MGNCTSAAGTGKQSNSGNKKAVSINSDIPIDMLFGGRQQLLVLHQQQAASTDVLLTHALGFLDVKDLGRLRKASPDFVSVVDRHVQKETESLVGKHIKPTLGQTPLEVLRAAQMLDSTSREWLQDWVPCLDLVEEGFEVGLPNFPGRRPGQVDGDHRHGGHILASIPCKGRETGAFVPVSIFFQDSTEVEGTERNVNTATFPRGFFPPEREAEDWLFVQVAPMGEIQRRCDTQRHFAPYSEGPSQ